MDILKFLFGPFAIWAPTIFTALVVLILIWRELVKEKWFKKITKKDFFVWERIFTDKRLIVGILIAGFGFASFLTVSQYYVWSLSAIGRFFLPPAQPTYFFNYAFLHFWLGRLIGLSLSLFIFGIFYLIRRYRRVLSRAEINLVFLVCLLVAWPRQILLVPLFFILAALELIIMVLAYKNKRFREAKIKIFWPLILATILALIFSGYLVRVSGLSALIV